MAEDFDQDNLDNLRESLDIGRSLTENAKILAKINKEGASDMNSIYNQVKKASGDLVKNLDKISSNYARYQKFEIKSKEVQDQIAKTKTAIVALQKRQNENIKKEITSQQALLESEKKRVIEVEKIKNKAKKNSKKYDDALDSYIAQKHIIAQREKELQLLYDSDALADQLVKSGEAQISNLEEYNKLLEKSEGKIATVAGVFRNISKIPVFGHWFDAEKGIAKMQQQTLLKQGFWKSLGSSIAEAFSAISKATVIIAAIDVAFKIFNFIKDSMFAADKQITNIARNMGITKKEAEGIRNALIDASQNASDYANIAQGISVTTQKNFETWILINDQLGTATTLGQRFLTQMSLVKNEIGLSDQAMEGLTLQSKATGNEVQDILGNITAINNLQRLQGKSMIANNKLAEATLKITGYLRSTFKGNTEELSKAVTQAHLMGTTLEKINDKADSFLNFESSISAELEAQLLTGRSINLDAARYFFMTNQTEKAMIEINKQLPTMSEWTKLNRISAEGLAKAFGMSKDELSDTILNKEVLTKLENSSIKERLKAADKERFMQIKDAKSAYDFLKGRLDINGNLLQTEEQLAALVSKEAFERLQQIDAEKKFNDAILKLKETFSNVFTGELINNLADSFVGLTNALNKGLPGLIGLGGSIAEARAARIGKLDADLAYDLSKTERNWANFFKAASGNNSYAKTSSDIYNEQEARNKQKLNPPADDFISRGNSITPFRKDDVVMGGTSLLGGGDTLKELQNLNQNIKTLIELTKEGKDINMDGYKVGTSVVLASYKMQ